MVPHSRPVDSAVQRVKKEGDRPEGKRKRGKKGKEKKEEKKNTTTTVTTVTTVTTIHVATALFTIITLWPNPKVEFQSDDASLPSPACMVR